MAQRDGAEGLGIAAELEELRRLEPPAQDAARRDAIMGSVLDLAAAQPAPRRVPRAAFVLAPLAAAAAILIAWAIAGRDAPQTASSATPAAALVLRSGSVQVAGATLGGGARIDVQTVIAVGAEPAELALRDASVLSAARDTRLVYTGDGEDRFRLQQGEVSLRVQHRASSAPLVVETEELSAWVVGTRFAVSRAKRDGSFATTVVVLEGLVRVVAKSNGQTQLLAAGSRITLPASSAPVPAEVLDAIAPSTPAAAPGDARAKAPAGVQRGAAPARHGISTVIRQKLKAGEIGTARRMIQRAQRERAASAVELAMLEAEADLAERHNERAKGRYLAIVNRYPHTSEAELSLFAAAQLSRGQAGIDLLQRYLARYPDGRFAKEAHRLLDALETRSSRP